LASRKDRDHGLDTAAAVLNDVQVLQDAHEASVAGRVLLFQVLKRHVTEEAPRALDLQPVSEHADLDVATPHVGAVVPMGDGVGDSFTQGLQGVLGDVAPEQAVNQRRLAHGAQQVALCLVHHLGDRPLKLSVVQKAFAAGRTLVLGGAVVVDEGDAKLREELQGVFAEGQQAGKGGTEHRAVTCQNLQPGQCLCAVPHKVSGARPVVPEASQVAVEFVGIQIGLGGGRHGLLIEGRLAPAAEIPKHLVLGHLAVGVAHPQVGPLG
jgi:hypothetical protein